MFSVLWLAFFFHGMTSGFWMSSLTNIFRVMGLSEWVAAAFMVPPLCALVSPVIGGALADQRMAANRLFVWSGLVGAAFTGGRAWHWMDGILGAARRDDRGMLHRLRGLLPG